ncbi:hypothetical protein COCVIDRAFT_24069 [Bipolaris victoriae FI3]|uniref:Uncharacterized protein n=1 Tax=Bipolaris victoriae (strain FI3) TaxID=930091 RepID=W7F1H8_BIPV3|nr:hypothetical protein COCVIDRAFT_24069 [Bipolaris victoriae FI3]
MSAIAPSGQWFFTGPLLSTTGNSFTVDQGSIRFRIYPDPGTLNPFLAALSKAALQMPVLSSLMLTVYLSVQTNNAHVAYHAPGQKAKWGDEEEGDQSKRRVYYAFEMGDWRPEYETAARLRKVGEERFGGEIVERFLKRLVQGSFFNIMAWKGKVVW